MFYEFDQNNSGGRFEGPAHTISIEATNANDANKRAEIYGLYFNGSKTGADCPCCGDRWYPAYERGTEIPEVYGKIPEVYLEDGITCKTEGIDSVHIVFMDGTVEKYK